MDNNSNITHQNPSKISLDEINYDYNSNIYIFKIEYESNIATIKITEKANKNSINCSIYKATISNQDLITKNRYFSLIEKISEFCTFFKDKITQKEITLEKFPNLIKVNLPVTLPLSQEYVSFEFPRDNVSKEQIISELCAQIDDMKSTISTFTKSNDELKSQIAILTKTYEEIKNKFDEISQFYHYNIGQLFQNHEQISFLKEKIKVKINRNIKGLRKLFQASIDGDEVSDFHKKCDGYDNILILIRSVNERIFGAFTSLKYDSFSNCYKKDEHAFIYSLDNMEIYECAKPESAVYIGSNCGVLFGVGKDLLVEKGCLKNYLSTSVQMSYDYKGKEHALTGGERFGVKDYEVFQVIFEY